MSRWVLKKVVQGAPLYLVDYKRPPDDGRLWDADVTQAERFVAALDAIEMARRLSYLLGVPIEAASPPGWDGSEGSPEPAEGPGGGTLLRARYDARDRLCAVLMCADLDDDEDFDRLELETARLFMTSPAVVRRLREEEATP